MRAAQLKRTSTNDPRFTQKGRASAWLIKARSDGSNAKWFQSMGRRCLHVVCAYLSCCLMFICCCWLLLKHNSTACCRVVPVVMRPGCDASPSKTYVFFLFPQVFHSGLWQTNLLLYLHRIPAGSGQRAVGLEEWYVWNFHQKDLAVREGLDIL